MFAIHDCVRFTNNTVLVGGVVVDNRNGNDKYKEET